MVTSNIHVTMVCHLCVHLSDIGFNAFLLLKIRKSKERHVGYLKASQSIVHKPRMDVRMVIDGKEEKISVAMIVIANGTKYRLGAVINRKFGR
jgi:hypothetical protein